LVVIAIGGNDRSMRMSAEQTRENLRRMVALYRRAGATVFLADRQSNSDGGDTVVNSLYAELAAEEDAILIPSLREGLERSARHFLADLSHPNAEGYRLIAERMLETLLPHLATE